MLVAVVDPLIAVAEGQVELEVEGLVPLAMGLPVRQILAAAVVVVKD